MNDIEIFENPEFGKVRALSINNEPWFAASDVCKALEIGNASQALTRLDDDEKMTTIISNDSAVTGKSQMSFVNEPGLYSLILGSRKKEARQFKRWITHDVVPTIRKYGMYAKEELLDNPDLMIQIITELKNEREARKLAEAEQQKLREENTKMLPKVQFAEAVTSSDTCILIGEMAKILRQNGVEIGQNRLFEWLRENGYLIKGGTSYNLPTQRAMEMGLFQIRESVKQFPGTDPKIYKTPMITGKGQHYFVNKFLNI